MDKEQTKGFVAFTAAIAIIILGLFLILKLLTYNYVEQTDYKLKDGWTISVNGDIQKNVSLSEVDFKNIKKGDRVLFKNTIPAQVYGSQTMIFNTYLSSVEVALDNDILYQYATKPSEANNIIGSGCHFVVIPPNSVGSTVIITVTAKQDNAFTNMEDFTFVSSSTAQSYYIDQKIYGIFISIFLLVLGIILSFVSAFALIKDPSNLRLTYIGIFSFFMGLWSMNNIKILQIFNIDLGASTSSEYFSLFAAPIPILCLFEQIRKDYSKIVRRGIQIITLAFFTFLVVTTILHFTKIVHYSQVLTMFHMMVAATVLFMLLTGVKRIKKKNTSEATMSLGFFILCLSFGLDIVRFNVQKYLMPNNDNLYESFIPLGTLLFIMLLLFSYISSSLDMLHEKAQQDILSHIAYHDVLCSIFNRAKCDEEFTRLDASDEEYALINFDLNGLKTINDHYGHESGDKLLSTFAEILESSFNFFGTCYRMGGDEFLVIVEKEHIDEIQGCLTYLKNLETVKSKECDFTIESSYGVAYRHEVTEGTAAKVYSLADKRMYEMKQASKIARRFN